MMGTPRIPFVLRLPILTAIYFVAGKLGLMLAFFHPSATAIWPPTGITLAAMLLLGYRVWPAIFVGAFLVNVTTAGSVATSIGIATGNTLEGLVGAFLVNRYANGPNVFARASDTFRFAGLAGLLSTAVSATMGVSSLALGGYANWSDYWAIWLTWWLGDLAGDLVVAPVLILWGMNRAGRPGRERVLEAGLLFLAVVLIGWTVFNGLYAPWIRNYPLEFLSVPPLVWAAFRFGQRETATGIALLSAIAAWGTLRGFGPFGGHTENEALLLLQAFMGTMAVMMLPLAAVVTAHARAEAALASVAAIVESSDDAIIGKTLDGVITSWNAGAERLYGYSAREAIGQPMSRIVPRELNELPMILERLRRGEQIANYETIRMRKDGRPVEVSVTVSPTRDAAGRIVGASSIARDITQRKRIEAALRERDTLRYVASLAYAAGHEINNPLAVVVGQAQMLASQQVDANTRRRITEIIDATWRIQVIVDRLRHVKRLELAETQADLPEMLDIRKSSS